MGLLSVCPAKENTCPQCQDSTMFNEVLWCHIMYQIIKTHTCPTLCRYLSPLVYIVLKATSVSLITGFLYI